MSKFTYRVNFQRFGDNTMFSWRSFKTYGYARRFIDFEMSNYWFRQAHDFNEWAISRECHEDWSKTCVLAQSKGFVHKTWFRNRSEADRWEPDHVTDAGKKVGI